MENSRPGSSPPEKLSFFQNMSRSRFVALWVAVGCAAVIDGAAHAAEPADTMEQRLAACAECHGKQGEGKGPKEYYPRIGGKPARYLYNQLVNFRDGRRSYPQMAYLVRYLTDDYLREIAEYYAKLRPAFSTPIRPDASPEAMARATALILKGNPANNLPACVTCHGKALTGMQPAIPGLLGLHPDYVAAQLGAWQKKARAADAPDCMAQIAAKLSGSDISALAKWLAAQPGSPATLPAPEDPKKLPLACGSQSR